MLPGSGGSGRGGEVFGATFRYEKDHAILFGINDPVPVRQVRACIRMALKYHLVKGLPKPGECACTIVLLIGSIGN